MRPWIEPSRDGSQHRVRWRDFHGQKKSSAFFPDEIQARRFAQMIAHQLSQQLALESTLLKTSTVRDTVELWLASVPVRNPETARSYRRWLEASFLKKLGDRNLASIRPLDLFHFARERIRALQPWSYQAEVNTIRRVFAFARDNLLLSVDPALSLHAPTAHSEKHRCLTWKEELELLRVLAQCNPKWLPRILLCRDTGMRMCNAHRLARRDLDLEERLVHFTVLKSAVRLSLPLTERLAASLALFQDLEPPELLFNYKPIREKRLYTGASVFLLWLTKKLSFTFDFHDLRYTFRAHFKAATGDRELTEYCLGHSLHREILSYYWTPPPPAELQKQFCIFDQYQEAQLALARAARIQTASNAEIWRELKNVPPPEAT